MVSRAPRQRHGLPRTGGTARAIATYLVSVRPLLQEITEARRAFIRHIGLLMEEARHAGRQVVVQAAGRIGRDEGAGFRSLRAQLERMEPPGACEAAQAAITKWINLHLAACDVMVDVGLSGDLGRLRETQRMLAEARIHAQTFNAEYNRLVSDLRRRVSMANDGRGRTGRRNRAPSGR